jgi:rhodanese-related sulfurtransferase
MGVVMKKAQIFLFGVVLGCSLPALAEQPIVQAEIPGVTRVNAEEVVDMINKLPRLVVIDSRRNVEFEHGHIEGSINITDTEMTPARLKRVAPRQDTPLLFYCNGERCRRSGNAAKLALKWGYSKVFWFRGGWLEWSTKYLPVAR